MHPLLLRGDKRHTLGEALLTNTTSFRSTTTAVTGTYTPSTGTLAFIVFIQGSGGYGGGTADGGINSHGGGSGGYTFKAYVVGTPNPSHTVADIQRLYTLLPEPYLTIRSGLTGTPTLTYLPIGSYPVYCSGGSVVGRVQSQNYIAWKNDAIGWTRTIDFHLPMCTSSSVQSSRFNNLLFATAGMNGHGASDEMCAMDRYGYYGSTGGLGVGGDYNGFGAQGAYSGCTPSWENMEILYPAVGNIVHSTSWQAQAENYGCGAPSALYPTKTPNKTDAPSIAYGCGGGGLTSGSAHSSGGAAIEIFEFS